MNTGTFEHNPYHTGKPHESLMTPDELDSKGMQDAQYASMCISYDHNDTQDSIGALMRMFNIPNQLLESKPEHSIKLEPVHFVPPWQKLFPVYERHSMAMDAHNKLFLHRPTYLFDDTKVPKSLIDQLKRFDTKLPRIKFIDYKPNWWVARCREKRNEKRKRSIFSRINKKLKK